MKKISDFSAFSQAGRELAHWHLNYETVECFPGVVVDLGTPSPSSASLPLPIATSKINTHQSSINHSSFASTVIDRRNRVEKMKFGKTKDPETGKSIHDKTTVIYNDFITLRETMGNAKYPLELFLRVVTVSLETMKIVNKLPRLEVD